MFAGSAVVTACVGPAEEPTFTSRPFTPTKEPTQKPATPPSEQIIYPPAATKPPEPSPTPKPEVINLPGVNLTDELVTKGLSGMGGEEYFDVPMPDGTVKRVPNYLSVLNGYTLRNWGETGKDLPDWSKDPVFAMQVILGIGGQYGGFTGETFALGPIFPALGDLRFFRLTINQEQETIAPEGALPRDLTIRNLANITVVGLCKEDGANLAVVTFDEGFDREKPGLVPRDIPRQYFAVVPQKWLEATLAKNGYALKDGELTFETDGKDYVWTVNTFGEDGKRLFEKIESDAGVFWMDQKANKNWYEDPRVPYPPQELAGVKTLKTAEGKLVTQDATGKLVAEAYFNEKTKRWEWKKVEETKPEQGFSQRKDGSIVYRTERGEVLVPQDPNFKTERRTMPSGKEVMFYINKEGKEAGFFYPYVAMVKDGVTNVTSLDNDTTLIGGVRLYPPDAKVLANKALAQFKSQEERYVSTLPVELKPEDNFWIIVGTVTSQTNFGPYNFMAIQAPEGSPVTSPFLTDKAQGVRMALSGGRDALVYPEGLSYLDVNKITPGEELMYLKLYISMPEIIKNQAIPNIGFGDQLTYNKGQPVETVARKHIIDSLAPFSAQGINWNILLREGGVQGERVMDFDHIVKMTNPDGSFSPVFS